MASKLKYPEICGTVRETNSLFRDFGIKERVKLNDWADKSPVSLENYRKKVISDFLNKINEREGKC